MREMWPVHTDLVTEVLFLEASWRLREERWEQG